MHPLVESDFLPLGQFGECNLAAARGATHFTHVVVVEKLVLSIVPFDPDARPIASRDRSPIRRAVMPRDALADF